MKNLLTYSLLILLTNFMCISCAKKESYSFLHLSEDDNDINDCSNNDYQSDADFYSDISQLGGERPEGAAALFNGFFNGLAHGIRNKNRKCKQKIYN